MRLIIRILIIIYLILIGLATLFLLVAHTFSFFSVVVDTYSVLLIGLLLLLPFVPSLKKIKLGDFEADFLKQTKNEVANKLENEFKINQEEKEKIYASTTAGSLITATADIIISKRICLSCMRGEMKQIPWKTKFNKSIEGKELASEPQVYKCDNCGHEFIEYTTN